MDTKELNPSLRNGIMPRQPKGENRRLVMLFVAVGVFLVACIAFVIFRILSNSTLVE